jgi:hypothetical protein
MPVRHTQRIELGTHLDKVGFTMTFDDGTQETHLFDLATAESLFRQGTVLVEAVKQQQAGMPDERIGIHDHPSIRLVP